MSDERDSRSTLWRPSEPDLECPSCGETPVIRDPVLGLCRFCWERYMTPRRIK